MHGRIRIKTKMLQRILLTFILISYGHVVMAATLVVNNSQVSLNEAISVTVGDLSGDRDWVGIYHKNDSNDWANVLSWDWVNNGTSTLDGVADIGEYEARLFFHNSFNMEASTSFNIASITTSKSSYQSDEVINLTLAGLSGDRDWVGIYHKNNSNDWGNVIHWDWANDGVLALQGIAEAGEYEARLFFHNSFVLQASIAFDIGSSSITTSKQAYLLNENISVAMAVLSGDRDWVGVYRKGDSNDWGNVLSWSWANGGRLTLGGVPDIGEYEARLFFHNSYETEAVASFLVTDPATDFWKKGPYEVAPVLELPAANAVVFSPEGLDGQALPVVFFAYGGSANQYLKHHTLLNFIASHGYHAIFFTQVSSNQPAWTARKYISAVESLKNHRGVNTAKVGIVGHSSGGGAAFGILKELMKAPNNYGSEKSFLLAIDPWFAYEMNKQDLMDLPENTNTVILQFGEGGNNMLPHPGFGANGMSFATDALIPLTLYKFLGENYPENVDYQIFEDVGGASRGHLYLYDDWVKNGVSGNNYTSMKGGLGPLGALMELTFEDGNEAVRIVALGKKDSNNQVIKPIDEYVNFKCHSNSFGVYTDNNGRLIDHDTQNYLTDIEYCNEVPRN